MSPTSVLGAIKYAHMHPVNSYGNVITYEERVHWQRAIEGDGIKEINN
jgi:hypothetical protein